MTRLLAARSRPLAGIAVKVVRISPRRYSLVTNMEATTITTRSPTTSPNDRLLDAVWVPTRPSTTAGAMSPEPLTTRELPAWW